METEQKIVLSISLLASNRKDTIRRCLDSLKPIMEQIPSELILVDTSKNPEVHQILLEYTDKVVEFEWCNDFAKARNTGLALAKGEWFLFLDDDEWFVDIEEMVQFFRSGEYRRFGCANYIVRNFYDKDYVNYSDSWVSRMIRIGKNTCFKSKIHEYLYPVDGECKALHSMAYHSGYIYATKVDRQRHFERNVKLLLDMIEEEPEELRWKVQLVQEYRSNKNWDKLYDFCMECLEQTKDVNNKYDNYDIGTFYAGAMEGLLFLKRYDEGIEIGNQALADKRNSELCRIYIEVCYGAIYYAQGNWKLAEESAHRYFRLCKHVKKDPLKLTNQQAALLVGEALDQIPVKRSYSILICCGLKRGDTSNLKKYLKYLEWDQKVIYAFNGMVDALMEAMANIPQEDILIEAVQLAWNNRNMREDIFHKAQLWAIKNQEGFPNILKVLAQLEGDHWYLWYAKILTADWEEDAELLKEGMEGYFKNVSNIFSAAPRITQIAKKNNISLEENYLSIPFTTWTEQLRKYLSEVQLDEILVMERELQEMKTRDDIRYDYSLMRIAEARLLFSIQEEEYDKKRSALEDFGKRTGIFYRQYYKDDALEQYPELLPKYAQAGLLIEKSFEIEADNPKAALEYLKQSVDVYQSFADVIKAYMKMYGEERERRERAQKEELKNLEKQIKAEVLKCMESRQFEDALQILEQLKQIRPDDLEVIELSLRARLAML